MLRKTDEKIHKKIKNIYMALFLFLIMAQDQGEKKNIMCELCICKLGLNICVGESGLAWAAKVLEQLTGQIPTISNARYIVRSFGIGETKRLQSAHCTVHEAEAEEILEKGLKLKIMSY